MHARKDLFLKECFFSSPPPLFWYCQTFDQQKVQVLNGLNLVMFFLTISHLLVRMLLDMVS
jgi:hypothetical protein